MDPTKTLWHWSLDCIVRRISDGTLYEPSYPDYYSTAQVPFDSWYFRRIVPLPKKWWRPFALWRRTGEIWIPKCNSEFDSNPILQ